MNNKDGFYTKEEVLKELLKTEREIWDIYSSLSDVRNLLARKQGEVKDLAEKFGYLLIDYRMIEEYGENWNEKEVEE